MLFVIIFPVKSIIEKIIFKKGEKKYEKENSCARVFSDNDDLSLFNYYKPSFC